MRMLSQEELQRMHTNQRLLVEELQHRGIDVHVLFAELELIEASFDGHKELILDRDSSINPYAASVVCGDKYLAKRLLDRAGLQVPQGEQFFDGQTDDALIYAQILGFPVVVKPTFGSHGDGVHLDLENLCHVKDAIEHLLARDTTKGYLVEEQFEGKEYRIFITKKGDFAVLHRDPAHVIGDGKRTVAQLAESISHDRMHPRTTALCPIALDDIAVNYLARSERTLDSIPDEDEKLYLRRNSNVASGGTCEDFTDQAHPSAIGIARRALDVFHGLPYAGIDLMSKDITRPQDDDCYRILEVNSVPGIHMHLRPGSGTPRNVAKYIVDMMFPETRGRPYAKTEPL
ncbi:MAG: hypothetical protein ABIH41_06650 [Nanoarchaeota archaeon]